MLGLGAGEIFLILAFALIFIGPKKLPELAKSLGKGVREFQNAKDELMNQISKEDEEPVQPMVAMDNDLDSQIVADSEETKDKHPAADVVTQQNKES